MNLEEECLKEARFYQRQFPSVTALSSKDLLRNFPHDTYQIVDCRSAAERAVATITGARSDVSPDIPVVICYCTIGYRSGLEARRLQRTHPDWTVYNLDGIVAFSHAVQPTDSLQLVNGNGQSADTIHTFAGSWNFIDQEKFHATSFRLVELPARFVQVGMVSVLRALQHLFSCCC